MFQNDLRLRSGKLNYPTIADISIQWLLQAYYQSMSKNGKNVHIFPVSINYERLFEIRNVADMMVSTEARKLSVLDIKSKFDVHKGHRLGRTYVLFGKPISLMEYFAQSKEGVLTVQNLNESALNLTRSLVVEHQLTSPVFLNQVVASLLLQCKEENYPLKELVKNCIQLYDYFKARDIILMMFTPPNKKNIERVLEGLGYSVKTTKSNTNNKTLEQVVVLTKKQNHRELLSLAYYTFTIS
jgi:glycerol-3-phosphate O-acyltransferase